MKIRSFIFVLFFSFIIQACYPSNLKSALLDSKQQEKSENKIEIDHKRDSDFIKEYQRGIAIVSSMGTMVIGLWMAHHFGHEAGEEIVQKKHKYSNNNLLCLVGSTIFAASIGQLFYSAVLQSDSYSVFLEPVVTQDKKGIKARIEF